MNPDQFAEAVAGQRPRRSYVAVLGFAAITMAATSAVLTWQERDFRGACTSSARLAAQANDQAMRRNAIVMLVRDARASIELLQQLEAEGGPASAEAKLAIQQIAGILR